MKNILLIDNSIVLQRQSYIIVAYNKDKNEVTYLKPNMPEITITIDSHYEDTDVIELHYSATDLVVGDIIWSCNLDNSIVSIIDNSILKFNKHFEGSLTLTASADNASAKKTITVTCGEISTSTTYSITSVVSPSTLLPATSTTANIDFTGITTYHYQLKDDENITQELSSSVTFTANESTETTASRSGSFDWNGQIANWSITLDRKKIVLFNTLYNFRNDIGLENYGYGIYGYNTENKTLYVFNNIRWGEGRTSVNDWYNDETPAPLEYHPGLNEETSPIASVIPYTSVKRIDMTIEEALTDYALEKHIYPGYTAGGGAMKFWEYNDRLQIIPVSSVLTENAYMGYDDKEQIVATFDGTNLE